VTPCAVLFRCWYVHVHKDGESSTLHLHNSSYAECVTSTKARFCAAEWNHNSLGADHNCLNQVASFKPSPTSDNNRYLVLLAQSQRHKSSLTHNNFLRTGSLLLDFHPVVDAAHVHCSALCTMSMKLMCLQSCFKLTKVGCATGEVHSSICGDQMEIGPPGGVKKSEHSRLHDDTARSALSTALTTSNSSCFFIS
jgi:hypothetical protein